MADLFVLAFLGHMFGDYFFQTDWMAVNKKKPSWFGIWACSVHSLVYTALVAVFLQNLKWYVWLSIFVSHWIVDRSKFVIWWMDAVKGLTLQKANAGGPFLISMYNFLLLAIDNTLHFLSLWLIIKILII